MTDGTDDVRLTVSVLDASGRLISNSPDVRLRIVSGPGEFPTGREICFSKNSDIQILDGLCAIEMRAYQSGKTVVEATSNGLTSGTIELEFVGGERYVEGKTPVVADRPYIQKRKARTDDDIQILGTNNPTFARSNAPGHSAGMAADGDEQTFWQPAPTDKAPQWVLDTERGITLKRVEVTLDGATDDVTVSISNDGGYYIQLAHYDRAPQKIVIEHNDLTMRFLKLNFGSPENAKIIEAKVFGWLED